MKGVYAIRNKVNNKSYIGMSMNLVKRQKEHFSKLRANKHENQRLQNAFNKYGEEAFEFCIIIEDDNFTQNEVFELETLLIRTFNTINRNIGYNLCLGGRGSSGWKMPKEIKEKRSIMYRGEGNPFYGKTHSPETIEKMLANRDYSFTKTEEYREKISKAMKGRKFSEEHSRNKSKAQMGGKNPRARKVSIEGKIYDCIQDAVNELGVKHTTIQYRLNATSERFRDWFYLD